MILTAVERFAFHPSTREQLLILRTVVGIYTVVGWVVRGAVYGGWVLCLLVRELHRAHRRGVARVRTYEAKLDG